MANNSQPSLRALLRKPTERREEAARAFITASAALQSVAASAAAARVAIDTASNAFIRAEASLNRAADALDGNEDQPGKGCHKTFNGTGGLA